MGRRKAHVPLNVLINNRHGPTVMRRAIEEILERAPQAPGVALAAMPADFAMPIHDSVSRAIKSRAGSLEAAVAEF